MDGDQTEASSRAERLEPPERALSIGAHPDDAEFAAGGTLAKWIEAGTEVTMLVVTDGSKGSWDPGVDPTALVEQRATEQRSAAAVLGAAEVVMLGHPDGELTHSSQLQEELALWIRRLRPEVVLTHDPWRRYLLHPDHRITGLATVDGVVAARDHLFFPHQLADGLSKHRPSFLLLWTPDQPDHWEDISPTLQKKLDALLCHTSQGTSSMDGAQLGSDHREAFVDRITSLAAEQGQPVGLRAAEAFKVVTP